MAKTNFFLVFEGRAGSGFLRAIMNSSPRVEFEAEWMLFNLREEPDPGAQQTEAANGFFEDPEHAELDALGFANKLSDLIDPAGLSAALTAHRARLISLKRRNLVKQTVSSLNALRSRERTGKFHAYSESDLLEYPFELDLDQFAAHLDRLVVRTEALEEFVAAFDGETIAVNYEDLVQEKEREIRRIANFLRTPFDLLDLAPPKRPIKQTPTDLREVVSNYEALLGRYTGTRFQPMIEDLLL